MPSDPIFRSIAARIGFFHAPEEIKVARRVAGLAMNDAEPGEEVMLATAMTTVIGVATAARFKAKRSIRAGQEVSVDDIELGTVQLPNIPNISQIAQLMQAPTGRMTTQDIDESVERAAERAWVKKEEARRGAEEVQEEWADRIAKNRDKGDES